MKKLLLTLCLAVLLIGTVSAAELGLDNYKVVSPNQKVVSYWDKGQIGNDTLLAEFELKTKHNEGVGVSPDEKIKVAEFEITNSFENIENMISQMQFYNVKEDMKPITIDYDLRYKTIEQEDLPKYVEDCEMFHNGTCALIENGTYKREVEVWKDYSPKTIAKGEKITIGIFTTTNEGDHIEWIPTFYNGNLRVEEWASFNATHLNGLISYYSFDYGDARDEYGTQYNFTILGGSYTNVTGKLGDGACDFDGAELWATREIGDFPTGDDERSVSVWFNLQTHKAVNENPVFTTGAYSSQDLFVMDINNNKSRFWGHSYDIDGNETGTAIGEWKHFVAVHGASKTFIYINGVLTGEATQDLTTSSTNISLGKSIGGAYADIQLDELAMWDRALTPSEISNIYNGGDGLPLNTTSPPDDVPEITVNSPDDEYNSTVADWVLNCTPTDDQNLTNVTFYVNDAPVSTNSSPINNTETFYTHTFSEGTSSWICGACDSSSNCTNSSPRNFNLDLTNPVSTIEYPLGDINFHENNTALQFNWTATDANIDDCWYEWNGVNTTVTCADNTTDITITNGSALDLNFYVNDTFGKINVSSTSWDYKVFMNQNTYSTTVLETALAEFNTTLLTNDSLTNVRLIYNEGTAYQANNSGTSWNASLFAEPAGNNSVRWEFTYDGDTIYSDYFYQNVVGLLWTACNETFNNTFLNVSFWDEDDGARITGAIPASTWVYYIGDESSSNNYVYTNNTESDEFHFCLSSPAETVYVIPYLQYKNGTNYPQRIWNPTAQTYTNTTTHQKLYLLSSDDGIYTTLQFLTVAGQSIEGVSITINRVIDGSNVTVATGTSDSSGTATFWVNPDFIHYFNFTASGYTSQQLNFAPTQTSYTITMTSTSASAADYLRGIEEWILPTADSLINDTSYDFEYNITSNIWNVSNFGFKLRLANGTIVGDDESTTEGTAAVYDYDTNNQSIIYMDYYYVINSTYINATRFWTIYNTENTDWSIATFFSDFNSYIGVGLFGLDDFGLNLIIFLILFISVGTISYKFGLTSPMSVSAATFAMIFFFDVVVDILPEIRGIENLLTYVAGLILVLIIMREVQR